MNSKHFFPVIFSFTIYFDLYWKCVSMVLIWKEKSKYKHWNQFQRKCVNFRHTIAVLFLCVCKCECANLRHGQSISIDMRKQIVPTTSVNLFTQWRSTNWLIMISHIEIRCLYLYTTSTCVCVYDPLNGFRMDSLMRIGVCILLRIFFSSSPQFSLCINS